MATKKTTAKRNAAPKTAMDRVKPARDPKRPHIGDFISLICSDFL